MIDDRPIGAALSRNLGGPTAPDENAGTELTVFIERRDKQRRQTEGERRAEEAWAESERRYDARRSEETRAATAASVSQLSPHSLEGGGGYR